MDFVTSHHIIASHQLVIFFCIVVVLEFIKIHIKVEKRARRMVWSANEFQEC